MFNTRHQQDRILVSKSIKILETKSLQVEQRRLELVFHAADQQPRAFLHHSSERIIRDAEIARQEHENGVEFCSDVGSEDLRTHPQDPREVVRVDSFWLEEVEDGLDGVERGRAEERVEREGFAGVDSHELEA